MDEAELSKLVLQLIEATAKLAATLGGVKETVVRQSVLIS